MKVDKAARPPGTEEALRHSIREFGFIHEVVMASDGRYIDGELRAKLAAELGVTPTVRVYDPPTSDRLSQFLLESQITSRNETGALMTNQIVRLASMRDDNGVGIHSEEAIAAALGVSVDYLIRVMSRYLKGEPKEDLRDLFPRERRKVNGEVGPATVTTADLPPPKVHVPQMPIWHDVLHYIPEVSPERYAELKASIQRNGQQVPVLLSPSGELVDGRARWTICQELGIRPVTARARGNSWEACLAANVARFPDDEWERIGIVARLPVRTSPTVENDPRPPTQDVACELFNTHGYTTRAFRRVILSGNPKLIEAVESQAIKIGTALRMIREIPREEWDVAVDDYLAASGKHTRRLSIHTDTGPGRRAAQARNPGPRNIITGNQVERVIDALAALGVVLAGDVGVDKNMTGEQATQLLSRLSTERRHLGRLTALLKQRREST